MSGHASQLAAGQAFEESPHRRMQSFDDFGPFSRAMCSHHFAWQMEPKAGRHFRARMYGREHAGITLTDLTFAPMRGAREVSDVRGSQDHFVGLILFLQGGEIISHASSQIEAGRGEMFLWDTTQPLAFESLETTRCLTTFFPKAALTAQIPDLDQVINRKFGCTSGAGEIFASHLQTVHDKIDYLAPNARRAVLRSTIGLLGTCLSPLEHVQARTPQQASIVEKIDRYIEDHMFDLDFGPATAAAGLSMSERTMRRTLAQVGLSFSRCVRDARLKGAAEILSMPGRSTMSITAIAFHFGFCDAAHFSRLFLERYGQSPTAFRAAHQAS